VALLFLIKRVAVILTSVGLLAATQMPAPVRVATNDLIGKWVTVSGDCSEGQHLFSANGKYKVWCFDSASEGEWSLRDGNKVSLRLDPKTNDEEIITILRIDRYSDHTDLEVRYQDGRREKWTK